MAADAEAAALPEEWQLYLVPTRAATFRNWPFTEGCACTPERMAAAGFVHCPSENGPDVAQCFFCFKELEGWEPDDDPLEEHKKHSAGCAFLSLQKDPTNLTLQEFLKLDKERTKNAIKKEISQKVTEVEDAAKSVRREIENLVS
ncbi:baculoviral IAP repeat-containing protein 5 [Gymnogyps californianus]|uniref:baculoviral IAP repeat-containing protein 5 n=1 Tax=Gymnogyps californianus TaxID=33616 RepID=UPI0021C95EF6|nr:baculoviral IAP repeat-containing protein 5 [Gymnogyps californianus]